MNAVTKLYCTVRANLVTRKAREEGQGLTEYLGLILIMGAALALGGSFLGGVFGGEDGPLVEFFQESIKSGLEGALENLGL